MTISFIGKKRIRKTFGRVAEVAPMPNLIEVQKSSYDHFLQMGVVPEQRAGVGLQEVFKSVFPIRDFSERAQLEFVRYELEAPKYEVDECQQRGITFAAPLKVTLRLVVWDVDEDTAVDRLALQRERLRVRERARDRRDGDRFRQYDEAQHDRRDRDEVGHHRRADRALRPHERVVDGVSDAGAQHTEDAQRHPRDHGEPG